MLKGGHEAPTKPKGRPKKNSIPTTEEIEAEERRLQEEDEERMKRERAAAMAHGRRSSQFERQDLSSETHNASAAMEAAEGEPLQLLMQSKTQAAR